MSSDEELVEVLRDEGVRAYYKQEYGNCTLIIFSDGPHSLTKALGAVRQAATLASRPARVRYRPAQRGEPVQIIVEYTGSLSDEESLAYGIMFVNTIKMLG